MKSLFTILLVVTVLSGCRKAEQPIAPETKTYLKEVLTLLETKSVNRHKINWPQFKADVLSHADSNKDTHATIVYALQLLQDPNSSFNTPKTDDFDNDTAQPSTITETIPKNIGYLHLTGFPKDEDEIEMYRQHLIQQITAQDNRNVKGWIVDLRGNITGPLSPMLASIAPVLGNGTVGYFTDGNSSEPWIIENGKVQYGTTIIEDIYQFHQLKRNTPPVAVITDNTTRNSGEAIAVAFKSRPNTRSFGASTYGHTSTNETYTLSDGATLTITVAFFADRNQKEYRNGVTPDQESLPNQTIKAALTWLQKQK
ncbi:S41 family peptidase [Flavobacterium cerinum]|uniref:S41 family peptidase n=1 Tax=Flavobacterium cerinum TaxID=2502784 RepID=A0ABY5IW69_9FLAO|nr:S41 family peptidase [Flavobacterium cerinum]UUC47064.1 S41 family peptidase [Flavobacterium cerinum]